jgi:hypothetical protein
VFKDVLRDEQKELVGSLEATQNTWLLVSRLEQAKQKLISIEKQLDQINKHPNSESPFSTAWTLALTGQIDDEISIADRDLSPIF